MAAAEISIATGEPEPPEADFAFYIDFKRSAGPASRVFEATQQFIKACERFDRALAASIDANIETVMVLEDIEADSLKTWLRSVLETTDDQALKDLDWKRIVGHYLVRSKYLVLKWIDRDRKPEDIVALSEDIQQLAEETGVRHLADYPQVNPASLIEAIKDFDEVKNHLAEGDEAAMIVPEGEPAEFDITFRVDIQEIQQLAVREVQEHNVPSMVLVVRKPDYLGSSMWDFRHGSRPLSARIEDEAWLRGFQARRIEVRPGDALRCRARIEMAYGHDNELIRESYFIEQVHEVLENRYGRQTAIDLTPDPDNG